MSSKVDLNSSNTSKKDDEIEDDEIATKYQPPKSVPLTELLSLDANDASLNKYKQQLVGDAINVILEPSDSRKLLPKRLSLVPDDHAEITFDLTGNMDKYKDAVITLKEGASYRIKLEFYVQRDIVCGLKFVQSTYKGPIRSELTFLLLLTITSSLYMSVNTNSPPSFS